MGNLGVPNINVSFEEKASSAITRSERGVVLLLVEETKLQGKKNPFTVVTSSDIPDEVTDTTKEQILLALKGYVTAPKKVLVYCLGDLTSAEIDDVETSYSAGLKAAETVDFNYIALPNIATRELQGVAIEWVKGMRSKKKRVKAVLPNVTADTEGIISYATNSATKTESITKPDGSVETTDTKYTAEQYCSRIAGMICGTPLTMSCTSALLPELTDCENQEDEDTAVRAGKFFLINTGKKVITSRAVNSLTTLTDTKGDSFKKIKLVEAMDMISDDIETAIKEDYIGRYPNTYDNKQLLIAAINDYLKKLTNDGIAEGGSVFFDIEAIKKYLIEEKGYTEEDFAEMSEEDIAKLNTGSRIFLAGTVSLVDAIEDANLVINI